MRQRLARRSLGLRSLALLAACALAQAPRAAEPAPPAAASERSPAEVEAFFRAVAMDMESQVQATLRQGFDPNVRSPQGQVALTLALREGSFKAAKLLLEQPRLAIDAANIAGETPLMMAALKGQSEWMAQLLARGAAINRPGWAPLHYAATGGHLESIDLLLSLGALIDAPAPNGNTPLMMAAGYGTIDAAEKLLKRGADPTLRNLAGRQASDFATSAGFDRLASHLSEAAAHRTR